MQPPLLARCHLGVIYPNLGVIWTWMCVMHLATGHWSLGKCEHTVLNVRWLEPRQTSVHLPTA